MAKRKYQHYTEEFRLEAVKRASQPGNTASSVAKELGIHPDCKKLVCFVYDPDGWVANPRGLENDLNSSDEDFECKVLIVPKGY